MFCDHRGGRGGQTDNLNENRKVIVEFVTARAEVTKVL